MKTTWATTVIRSPVQFIWLLLWKCHLFWSLWLAQSEMWLLQPVLSKLGSSQSVFSEASPIYDGNCRGQVPISALKEEPGFRAGCEQPLALGSPLPLKPASVEQRSSCTEGVWNLTAGVPLSLLLEGGFITSPPLTSATASVKATSGYSFSHSLAHLLMVSSARSPPFRCCSSWAAPTFALVLPIKHLYWQGFNVLRSPNEVEKIWNDFFFLPGTRFWSDDLISGWKGSGSIYAQVVLSAKALLYVGLYSNSYCLALEQLFWRFPYAFCTSIINSKNPKNLAVCDQLSVNHIACW